MPSRGKRAPVTRDICVHGCMRGNLRGPPVEFGNQPEIVQSGGMMRIVIQRGLNFRAGFGILAGFDERRSHVVMRGRRPFNRLPVQHGFPRIFRQRKAQVIPRDSGLGIDFERRAKRTGRFGFASLIEKTVAQIVLQIVAIRSQGDGMAAGRFACLPVPRFILKHSEPCQDFDVILTTLRKTSQNGCSLDRPLFLSEDFRKRYMGHRRFGIPFAGEPEMFHSHLGKSGALVVARQLEPRVRIRWICFHAGAQYSGLDIAVARVDRIDSLAIHRGCY